MKFQINFFGKLLQITKFCVFLAAKLMHKYGAHSATDITGFGLMGDANKIARETSDPVEVVVHTLPIIKDMAKLDKPFKFFKLLKGYAPETSGPLFIMIPADVAEVKAMNLLF